jgi:hypothetical protein
MLVTPSPISALFFDSKPPILPVALLSPLFHQPVPVGAIFVLIPFVPVTAFPIVVAVVFVRKANHRHQERTTEC